MKDKIVFKREDEFKEWLPKNGVVSAVKDYVSYIRAIQDNLQIDVDKLLEQGIDKAIERVSTENIPHSIGGVSNCRSGLKKYYVFTQSKD